MDVQYPAVVSDLAAPGTPIARRRPSLKLIVAGIAALLVFVYLITTAMGTSTVYYLTVSELKAKGAASYNVPVRVGGRAGDGTILSDAAAQTLHFSLTDNTGSLQVVYKGIVPDMFGYAKDGHYQDAVVEGTLQPDGVFQASQIIVKHDASFAAADAQATAQAGSPPVSGKQQSR